MSGCRNCSNLPVFKGKIEMIESLNSAAPLTLRRWLRRLASTNRLVVARPDVGLKYQLAAIAKRLDGSKAVLFPRPDGHGIPIVSGFMARR
ncbi:MAG TPA: hypothetical protein VIR04_03905, partial [Paralcaligenes sp.]